MRDLNPLTDVEVGGIVRRGRHLSYIVVVSGESRHAEVEGAPEAQALVRGQRGSTLRSRGDGGRRGGKERPGDRVHNGSCGGSCNGLEQITSVHAVLSSAR